ncbi:MAG: alpha-L-arabinofuranosidase [Lachnospiraceae bacterium]|nr:alpha-L-arabinofuranosidase [Lachnospiraceae bacterium]
MQLQIDKKMGVAINDGMIGLFFEDINYAADGGLYAEMIENRAFEFLRAEGDAKDYYTEYDGGYAWSPYPAAEKVGLRTVMGSPHCEENPHYMRVKANEAMSGLSNKAYDGICLKKDMEYKVSFFARNVKFSEDFVVWVEKDGKAYTDKVRINVNEGTDETYNFFKKYELTLKAMEEVRGASFVLCLSEPGVVEFDYISMFPEDAVAGIFRKDLFEKLKELKPGFIRFPGGCIVEGNTLDNRYRFKDSLKPSWQRKNNWNRWAVHGNNEANGYCGEYSHYNQTLGLGYYEYFLLCELIGAKPLPVLNVGFACQYQSEEMVGIDSEEFKGFLQDAIDLIEFANGSVDSKWGAVRAQMGHAKPFKLQMIGVGNEQWQTDKADFFERYVEFEKVIHEYDSDIKLIGSAGPDITSERYTMAWDFYKNRKEAKNFVYAVDEHYYVKPEWLLSHVDFYDNYERDVKVFSGEYAAHPTSGMNKPEANSLWGALAEAAFLTGVERNADVVVLASYAPLFAKLGYAQWSPDMIWFDGAESYGTPSYYVQQMYADNMGTMTIDTLGKEKEAAKEGIYYSLSFCERTGDIIVKAVNATDEDKTVELVLDEAWGVKEKIRITTLGGQDKLLGNTISEPSRFVPVVSTLKACNEIKVPANSFVVARIS